MGSWPVEGLARPNGGRREAVFGLYIDGWAYDTFSSGPVASLQIVQTGTVSMRWHSRASFPSQRASRAINFFRHILTIAPDSDHVSCLGDSSVICLPSWDILLCSRRRGDGDLVAQPTMLRVAMGTLVPNQRDFIGCQLHRRIHNR